MGAQDVAQPSPGLLVPCLREEDGSCVAASRRGSPPFVSRACNADVGGTTSMHCHASLLSLVLDGVGSGSDPSSVGTGSDPSSAAVGPSGRGLADLPAVILPHLTAPSCVPAWVPAPRRSSGAFAGLPSRYSHPKSFRSDSTVPALERCFVKRSAGFSVPRTFRSSRAPLRIFCCNQRHWVSMWRSLPKPLLPQIPMVAVESVQARRGRSTPRSRSKLW